MAKHGRAITQALREAVAEAMAAGCENPNLFFEPESHSIFVMDGDHPGYIHEGSAGHRQEAIVARIPLGYDIGAPFDAGAW